MLKITVKDSGSEQRWTLHGRLTKDCIAELLSIWRSTRSQTSTRHRIVELNEITVIDKSGEEVLSMMIDEGATFVATGLYTKLLLETLRERAGNSPIKD